MNTKLRQDTTMRYSGRSRSIPLTGRAVKPPRDRPTIRLPVYPIGLSGLNIGARNRHISRRNSFAAGASRVTETAWSPARATLPAIAPGF